MRLMVLPKFSWRQTPHPPPHHPRCVGTVAPSLPAFALVLAVGPVALVGCARQAGITEELEDGPRALHERMSVPAGVRITERAVAPVARVPSSQQAAGDSTPLAQPHAGDAG